jgi:hypothetical protein
MATSSALLISTTSKIDTFLAQIMQKIMKFCNLQFHPMVFPCKIAAQFLDTFFDKIKKICRDLAWLACREYKLGTGFWYPCDMISFQQTKQY